MARGEKMSPNRQIKSPFFEIGPKTFMHGAAALTLARAADEFSKQYDVDIIFTAQYTDIERIKRATNRIRVYAQHMDCIRPGRGIGAVLPEAIKDAGADGVMLNHAERPLDLATLHQTILRAKEVGLETIVCAGTPEEGIAITIFSPDIILVESPRLIGTGKRSPEEIAEISQISQTIKKMNPKIKILFGAGISNEKDVYEIIKAGAEATGSTSGIMKADQPILMLENMIKSVHKAWIETHR
jgi:triosephosphate isomerase